MRRLLASPRRRRRIIRWGAVSAVVAACAVVGILYPNTGKEEQHFRPGKPTVVPEELPSRPVSRATQRAAENVLSSFVISALLRDHPARSWDIIDPSFRSGFTRRDFKKGVLPVAPFPEKSLIAAKLKLTYSRPNIVRYRVLLIAKPGTPYPEQMYSIELKLAGRVPHRRWLVDYSMPEGGGISTPTRQASSPPSDTRDTLAFAWILVPLGFLSLIVIVPCGLALRNWLSTRRAARLYADPRPLPPLEG